jgi:ClpX C4-type zinc finger
MKCFEVTINGQKVCTAGIGDDGVLTSILSLVAKTQTASELSPESGNETPSESLNLRVGGLASSTVGVNEAVEWLHRDLEVGDEIVIRIIEAPDCDDPTSKEGRTSKEASYIECCFCGKKQAEAKTLIAGPAVYVCHECVRDCSNALAAREPTGSITMILSKEAEATCSFCGRKPVEVDGIVGVPLAKICNECVKICEEILVTDAGR